MFAFTNKYTSYAIAAIIAISILTTYVVMWRSSIRKEALLEFNNKQLEQIIKDQEKNISDLNNINQITIKVLEELKARNDILEKQVGVLETYLNSTEVQKSDRLSSDILNETIKQLSGQK